jgi:hypothetical protein
MKTLTYPIILVAFFAILSTSGCQSPATKVDKAYENKKDAKDDLTKAEERYQLEIDSYKSDMSDKVIKNEADMKELRAQAKLDKEASRLEMNQQLDKLEEQNNNLKQKLADYKHNGDNSWDEFKMELNKDMDDLSTAFSNFRTKNNK